jgi:iron complex outermembrane recepter protein
MGEHRRYTAAALQAAVAILGTGAGIAKAEDPPAGDAPPPMLEEIVVTAEKRAENLQRVPLSITAFSAKDIESRSASSLESIAQATPNVSFQSAAANDGGAASSVIYVRGIGTNLVGIGAEPGVGVYVNGVYQGRLQGLDLDMLDITRVEVLKGPQGTLYGKNTIGGAVNIIPALPDVHDEGPSGRLEAIGGRFDRVDALANLNVPVIRDELAVRLAVATRNDEGYATRIEDGQSLGNTRKLTGRISALFTPSSDWDVLANVDATRIRQHNADIVLPTVATPTLARVYNTVFTPKYDSQWVSPNGYDNYATGPNVYNALLWGGDLTVTWHPGPFELKSITGFRHNSTTDGLDADGSPITVLETLTDIGQQQLSQELQLTGNSFENRLKWVGGLYFFQESAREQTNAAVFPVLQPIVGELSFLRVATVENHDYAAYAQGTYSILDDLHMTLGLRYTREYKAASFTQSALFSGTVQSPLSSSHAEFPNTSPRIGFDYQWTPTIMTYVSAARGYKSGGFNNISVANVFGPEKAWTYEVGTHTDWLENRLRANLSAFWTDYTDIQVSEVYATPTGKPLNLIANAAKARIRGAELELTALPFRALRLSLNGGFTDAAFTSAVNTSGSGLPPVTSASPFVNVPRWTGSLTGEYTLPLSELYDLSTRVDYTYRSVVFHDISGSLLTRQGAYGLLNARLSFGPNDDRWSIAAFGTNLTNKHYLTGATDFTSSFGFVFDIVAPPAEWGVDVRYRF